MVLGEKGEVKEQLDKQNFYNESGFLFIVTVRSINFSYIYIYSGNVVGVMAWNSARVSSISLYCSTF